MKNHGFDTLTLRPIARLISPLTDKFGAPRQSGRVKDLTATVVFEGEYAVREALRGIEGFSHLWLIWGFSLDRNSEWSPTVRPPRLGGNKRVGVFATRSPHRPNPVGLSCVRLLGVREQKGKPVLLVGGADLVSGTPIYDIKPYLPGADRIDDAVGGFADAFDDYALKVEFPKDLFSLLPEEEGNALLGILKEDPRPGYRRDEGSYGLSFAGFEIGFFVKEEKTLVVTSVKPKPRE